MAERADQKPASAAAGGAGRRRRERCAEPLPPDRIHVRDLHLRCIVGVNEEERTKRQDVIISLELDADLRAAGASDDLRDTVDYKALKLRVMELVERSSFFLVERLAEEIARVCLETPGVRRVRVVLDKPGALRFARSVGVEIVRARE